MGEGWLQHWPSPWGTTEEESETYVETLQVPSREVFLSMRPLRTWETRKRERFYRNERR
ncbi:unnamed protein product [Ectocarpus sp. 12 AP-2014]